MREATIIGGGLAGSELALQLSARDFRVSLVEMRPARATPAHTTPFLAELVCSNSLKSENIETASGLLKKELEMLGCRLLAEARKARVPAGHALAVDRELFASRITELIENDAGIAIDRREQEGLDLPETSVIASGPLTSDGLSKALEEHFTSGHLYFYDAVSISVDAGSIDTSVPYRASRYGKGGADYLNIPFSKDEYDRLVCFLIEAPKTKKRGFEESLCFDACLPVEVIAARGKESLSFGPMKPKGLADPRMRSEPHAVLQLRQENREGTMLGLVGFQTRLNHGAQKELLKLIPGLSDAEILRYGAIHRNTYLDAPRLLDGAQMSRSRRGLFFAGQIAGVEGYVESIAHGLVTALNIAAIEGGGERLLLPPETIIGGLQRHMIEGEERYQPMNANFGLLPAVKAGRKYRKRIYADRSIERMEAFIGEIGHL